MTEFRKMTNYPNIYDVYWGNKIYNGTTDCRMIEIFENRNKFIENYNISNKRNLYKFKELIHEIRSILSDTYFDHSEYYKTNDGKYVLLVNPYYEGFSIKDKMEEFGFIQIENLYDYGYSSTWIKIFNTTRDLKEFHKYILDEYQLIECYVEEFDEITQTLNNNRIRISKNKIKELKNKIKTEKLKMKVIVYKKVF